MSKQASEMGYQMSLYI